jgi:hypothetical protein
LGIEQCIQSGNAPDNVNTFCRASSSLLYDGLAAQNAIHAKIRAGEIKAKAVPGR